MKSMFLQTYAKHLRQIFVLEKRERLHDYTIRGYGRDKMKRKTKRSTALIAILIAALVLSACGAGGDGNDGNETVFVPEYKDLKIEGIQKLSGFGMEVAAAGGRIYLSARDEVGTRQRQYNEHDNMGRPTGGTVSYEETVWEDTIVSLKEDGTDARKLMGYKPAEFGEMPGGAVSNSSIMSIGCDESGNIYVTERVYLDFLGEEGAPLPEPRAKTMETKPEEAENSVKTFLRKLDSNGAELKSINIGELANEEDYFDARFKVTDKGDIVLAVSGSNLVVLNSELEQKGELGLPEGVEWLQGITELGKGKVAVSYYDNKEQKEMAKQIDTEKMDYGEEYALPQNAYEILGSALGYDIVYKDYNGIRGYSFKSKETSTIVRWVDSDIQSDNISFVHVTEDGKILCCLSDQRVNVKGGNEEDYTPIYQIALLKQVKRSELPKRTELTFACMYLNHLVKNEIIKFNRENTEYRIVVRDYSEYNTENDYNAGRLKFTTELTSGFVPDIIDTEGLPVIGFAKKGVLTDLMPLLSADEKLGGEKALVAPVLKSLQDKDGKLFSISYGYSVTTAIAPQSIVGDKKGLSAEESAEALLKLKPGASMFEIGFTQESMLNSLLYMGMDKLVDRAEGKCSFDSPEFKNMLQFVKTFPEEYDWEKHEYQPSDDSLVRFVEGRQLFMTLDLGDTEFYYLRQIFNATGGKFTVTGLPGAVSSDAVMHVYGGLGVSDACRDKDGAWQFIRRFLTEDYQRSSMYYGMPINKAVFEEKVKEAMSPKYEDDPDAPGGKKEVPHISYFGGPSGDIKIDVFEMSQAEYDLIMEILERTAPVTQYDEQLMEIIREEAQAFLKGTKSVDAVAATIQNRASTYISEQS